MSPFVHLKSLQWIFCENRSRQRDYTHQQQLNT